MNAASQRKGAGRVEFLKIDTRFTIAFLQIANYCKSRSSRSSDEIGPHRRQAEAHAPGTPSDPRPDGGGAWPLAELSEPHREQSASGDGARPLEARRAF